MLRGFLSGIFWGAVMITGVMGFVSLLAPLPSTVDPQVSAAETTTGSDKEDSGDIGEVSQTDDAVDEGASPTAASPGDDDSAPLADTESAPQPNPDASETEMSAPGTEDTSMAVSTQTDAPVGVTPTAPTPEAPEAPELSPEVTEGAGEGSITNNPAQPMAPAVTEEGAFEAPAEETPDPVKTPQSADVSPSAEAQEDAEADESLLKPTTDLKSKFNQHESSRLPRIGAGEATDTETTSPEVSQDGSQGGTPFETNAVAFDPVGDNPLMSIVLIDDGAPEIDPAALQSFPYPLSIAIGTLVPDLDARVKTYQDMGFEVLAMIDIPAAAAPTDVEVAMDAHLAVMPQVVAILEGIGDGLQGSKAVSDQVTAVLQASGHGLVLFPKGLNTAQKLASREGVPAASVFRDFDANGQSANVIRRFLDQAAFKADREGGVIMIGRLREETLSALLVWGLQDRAGSVSLAPVSAVISAKQP